MDPTVLAAQIASIDAKLTSGVTQMVENGRLLRFDPNTLRIRRAELIGQYNALAAQLGIPPYGSNTLQPNPIRRVLPITYSKGL